MRAEPIIQSINLLAPLGYRIRNPPERKMVNDRLRGLQLLQNLARDRGRDEGVLDT
jgi:hypothetical protein